MVSFGVFFALQKCGGEFPNDIDIWVLVAFSYFSIMDKKKLIKYSIAFGIVKKVVLAIFIYYSTI
tara:strand:+ start:183 stop:377 length:195 start_codon:yes stop_codon:yes gene_type:complete